MKLKHWLSASFIVVLGTVNWMSSAEKIQASSKRLEVGIAQRFGANADDEITITSPNETPLTVKIKQQGDAKSLKTDNLTLNIQTKSLSQPQIREKVVLSNHATFETAKKYAQVWEKRGLPVTITQPARWEVWAQPKTYDDPLLRRMLLIQLQKQGYESPYIKTRLLKTLPRVSVTVGEKSYTTTQQLKISHQSDRIYVDALDAPRRLYPGQLRLQPNSYGDYTLVNLVPIEQYLRGVVPHEIGKDMPFEAVKAQAIIARTYALDNRHRYRADGYELCADTHCQVYRGLSETYQRSDRAIEATAKQVLTYNGNLIDAVYSSTTGGVTAFYSDIWDGKDRPYLKPVIDSTSNRWNLDQSPLNQRENLKQFLNLKKGFNETGTSRFRWEKESDLESLTNNLQSYLQRINHPKADEISKIQGITVTARSRSGRILKMDVKTDQGIITLEKTEVRSAFDPPLSTLFYLEPLTEQNGKLSGYRFIGGGFGHGVGLSQMGARQLAQDGWSAQRILSFYYPGTKMVSF